MIRLDVGTISMSFVLEKKLLQVKECFSMIGLLAHLNQGSPKVFGLPSMAISTHHRADNEFNDKYLLQYGSTHHFLLNGQLDFDTARMRFGPHKIGVNKLHLVQSFDLL